MAVRGGPWRSPWSSVRLHGGLHGGPWRSVEVSIKVREGSMEVSIEVCGGR